jgi:hypothetical protein
MVVKMFKSDKHFGLINIRQRVMESNTALDRKEEAAVPDTVWSGGGGGGGGGSSSSYSSSGSTYLVHTILLAY